MRSQAEVDELYWRASDLAREIIFRNQPQFGMFFDDWPEGRDKEACRRLWEAVTTEGTENRYNALRAAIAYAEGK